MSSTSGDKLISHLIIPFTAYLAFASLSLAVSRGEHALATIWFANVVGGFAVARLPTKKWLHLVPVIALANFVADFPFSHSIIHSLAFLPANVSEVFLIAWVLKQSETEFETQTTLSAFLKCLASTCFVPVFLCALFGAIALSLLYKKPVTDFWGLWAIGGMVGAVTLFPICLQLSQHSAHTFLRQVLEPKAILVIALSTCVTYASFLYLPYPYAYLCALLSSAAIITHMSALSVAIMLSGVLSSYMVSKELYTPQDYGYSNGEFFFYVPMLLTLITPMVIAKMMSLMTTAKAQLQQAKEDYVSLYEKTPAAMHSIDHSGNIISVSDKWLELLGYTRSEVIGKPSTSFLTEASAKKAREQILPEFFKAGKVTDVHYQMLNKKGYAIDIELSGVLESSTLSTTGRSMAVINDKTREYSLAALLSKEKKLLKVTLTSIGDGVVATDANQKITFMNPVAESMLAISETEAKGRKFTDIVYLFDQITKKELENPLDKVLTDKAAFGLSDTTALKSTKGDIYCVQNSVSPIMDKAGNIYGAVMVFQDVTTSRAMSEKMSHLAQHDALTGLPNRVLLMDRLTVACHKNERKSVGFSVVFIDLDNFKTVNDSLGHSAGDELLKIVSKRLKKLTRRADTVSRLGGDEFVLILDGLAKTVDITTYCERILLSISEPILIKNQSFRVTPSIGIAVSPGDGAEPELLLRHADSAMYKAKNSGRNRFQFYSTDIELDILKRVSLERKFHAGIRNNEFFLFYQQIVDTKTGENLYWEALCRWKYDNKEVIPPSEFIPLAEELKLIDELSLKMLKLACNFITQPTPQGVKYRVSFNISVIQLSDELFVENVEHILRESGAHPSDIVFEITESVLMKNWEKNLASLQKIKRLGITLAIDDFGTGYSSLSYLKRFPFDIVKIDREFVRDLVLDPQDKVFVLAIITMAQALGLQVVAEGVETKEQSDILSSMGCYLQQGFLFGEPIDKSKVHENNLKLKSRVIDFKQS
ncbi:EAL domain-containing protein [Pseudoalteromonas rubra]|uniref:EAL domain-containing protein n=1 Tax=Pseudoalteromonas rubra TaxID=43658 RepID=UPI000F7786FD|nr:EAL domain-containing protein [Pseudoalteromonas rubra]